MARIIRSPQSRVDYLEIWLYIAPDNEDAANRLLRTFDEKLKMLAESPGIGRSRDELAKGLRSYAVGNHLIFYRTRDDGIELVRVIHGARNLKKIFRRRK